MLPEEVVDLLTEMSGDDCEESDKITDEQSDGGAAELVLLHLAVKAGMLARDEFGKEFRLIAPLLCTPKASVPFTRNVSLDTPLESCSLSITTLKLFGAKVDTV
jgi:hypothetical protein